MKLRIPNTFFWNLFEIDEDGLEATCIIQKGGTICGKRVKKRGRVSHLRFKHPKVYEPIRAYILNRRVVSYK